MTPHSGALEFIQAMQSSIPKAETATRETISITLNDEQFSMIMASLEEIRTGQTVTLLEAFSDLNESEGEV